MTKLVWSGLVTTDLDFFVRPIIMIAILVEIRFIYHLQYNRQRQVISEPHHASFVRPPLITLQHGHPSSKLTLTTASFITYIPSVVSRAVVHFGYQGPCLMSTE